MMAITEIEKIAKDVIETTGKHRPQALIEDANGRMTVAVLMFDTDEQKNQMIKVLKKMVEDLKSDRYFIIMEVWMTKQTLGEKLHRRPKLDVNREEALMICEYRRDRQNKTIYYPFNRMGDKIMWEKEVVLENGNSIWDAYVPEGVVDQFIGENLIKNDDAFFKRIGKELADKYKKEFFSAKTEDERKKVLLKLIQEGKQIIKDQDKTMFEEDDG